MFENEVDPLDLEEMPDLELDLFVRWYSPFEFDSLDFMSNSPEARMWEEKLFLEFLSIDLRVARVWVPWVEGKFVVELEIIEVFLAFPTSLTVST